MASKFDSKKIFSILLNIAVCVAILLGLAWSKWLWNQTKSLQPFRTISISAEGKTVVSPDIASISFSVVSEGADPEVLTVENAEKMNAAIEFVKGRGIESKDIRTANYNLSPRYEYDEKRRRTFISGYTVTQTVFLKIRDFAKIGQIVGGLPEYGVNDIGALSFDIEDPDKYLSVAREEAFAKARVKAESMAEQNDVRLGRVITFSEGYGGIPTPMPLFETFGKGGDSGPVAVPSIEPGTQEVTITVNVIYEIR